MVYFFFFRRASGVITVLLLTLLFSTDTLASPRLSDAQWHEGVIILRNQKVYRGQLHYDRRHDLVLLREGEESSIATLAAQQVASFFYYDSQDNIIHRFRVINQRPYHSYPISTFYEIVADGALQYLRRPVRCPAQPPRSANEHTVAYAYFAYYRSTLVRSHHFERKLLPALVREHPTLADYVRSHKLRPYDVGDQVRLTTYFNQSLPSPLAQTNTRDNYPYLR